MLTGESDNLRILLSSVPFAENSGIVCFCWTSYYGGKSELQFCPGRIVRSGLRAFDLIIHFESIGRER